MPVKTQPIGPLGSRRVTRTTALLDCLLLLALSGVLRFGWLDKTSLGGDEFFSVVWSQLDPSFLLGQGALIEPNPPSYYLLLHAWIQAFGATPFMVRLPSAFFSTATVIITYAIGRTLQGRQTALLAAVFAALSPMAIFSAQEARTYALTVMLDGLALLALARYGRGLIVDHMRQWTWLGLFILSVVASFLTHYTSLFFIAACFTVVGLYLVTTRPFSIREALIWCGAGLAIAVCIAKPLIIAVAQSRSPNIAWIDPLGPTTVGRFFIVILTYPGMPKSLMGAICIGLLLVLASPRGAWVRARLDNIELGVLVLVPLAFCLIITGVSLSRPIMLPRVGYWLVIPLCLLLARAVTLQPTKFRCIAAATGTLLIFMLGIGSYLHSGGQEDWRGASQRIATDPRCDGPVLFPGSAGLALMYYEPNLVNRPFYSIRWSQTDPSATDILLLQILHPHTLGPSSFADFVQTHPHTALALRSDKSTMSTMPLTIRGLFEQAPVLFDLRGVSVACF